MRHQTGNVFLHRERPLHDPEIFGIWGIPVTREIKARAKTPTYARQNDNSAIGVNRYAIKHLM
jgi:hypothetical protein